MTWWQASVESLAVIQGWKRVSFTVPEDYVGRAYDWIADFIENRIVSGELRHHVPLPNERRMAEEFDVSLGTYRKAVKVLRDRGRVLVVPGRGVFVLSPEHAEGSG